MIVQLGEEKIFEKNNEAQSRRFFLCVFNSDDVQV